jgi:uncharacterized protein YndB with AHSA1/START domain
MAEKNSSTLTLKSPAGKELILTRVFDAPRELVWQAWTEARHLAQWWGPQGFTNPVCEVDLRPGGAIRIDMRWPQGDIISMSGTFHEIIAPEQLVFISTAGVGDDGEPLLAVHNTVTFAEQCGKTLLTLKAVVIKAAPEMAAALAGMEEGWSQSLVKLADYLTPLAASGYAGLGLTCPSDNELRICRQFSAPPSLIYSASTTPEHLRRWWGLRSEEMTVCEVDLRVGGGYHFVLRTPEGQEYGFHGEYRELAPGRRIVQTFVFEPMPDAWTLETLEFEAVAGGTLLTVTVRHLSQENRDGQLKSGMLTGVRESWDRLEELLATLAGS